MPTRMKLLTALALAPTLLLAAPKPLFSSKLITTATPGHSVDVDVDLTGAKEMFLVVTDGGNGIAADWSDWAEPRLIMADGSEKKLTEVEWKSAQAGWGEPHVNANAKGGELRSNGKPIEYGIGTHSNSVIEYILPAGVKRFKARGALDEGGTKQGATSVEFRVYTENPGPVSVTDASSHDPAEAVANMEVNPELKVQLFASEPMMLSPSSIDVDAQGRVWVCEVVNYRSHNGERPEGDRILILEDTDHDGKADKVTVFYQGNDINSAHGICVLGNRVLVSCGDEVFWLIDDDGDGKADRKEVMFTKIGGAQHDHGIHAVHFGPDGRLYFNHGNAAKQLCDKDGNLITDIHGVMCTNQNNLPYQDGMVYRCELDGSKVELLAWNFRNNWEVAVDSFGTMWQSDNDDDGNKGVRINYVMEFGNYGYKDEKTGAGWQTPRIGWESEIPLRHWHQNDPGVIPNLLQTGAGSPTGMMVYEGDLLPSIFHGQPIHCDAGPNVVRGYITQPDGAGFKAEIVNVMEGSKDRWFRPSDVCVAPDGSLMVADWYDPGVGGHGMGDLTRGRVFRVTVPGSEKYEVKSVKLDSVEGAVEALKSPNEATRYLAWMALTKFGVKAEPALKALFDDKKAEPQHRARALWAMGQNGILAFHRDPGTAWQEVRVSASAIDQAGDYRLALSTEMGNALRLAIQDDDERLQATAHRLIRRLEVGSKVQGHVSPPGALRTKTSRREAAISLRFDSSPAADRAWASLASGQHGETHDRWMIEALGVGAELHWDSRIKALQDPHAKSHPSPASLDEIIWRSRASKSPGLIAEGILNGYLSKDPGPWLKPLSLLRALQLQPKSNDAAVAQAAMDIFLKADSETSLAATALLDRKVIASNPEAKARLDALLKPVIGKAEFVDLVQRLNLTGFEKEMLDFITAHPEAPEAVTAAKLLAMNVGGTVGFLKKADEASAKSLVVALGRVSDRPSVSVLSQAFWPEKRADVRQSMIEALALSSEGGKVVLKWNAEKKLPEAFKLPAALALSRSTDAVLRAQAAKELPLPVAPGAEKFPAIPELMKMAGNAAKGPAMFIQAGCVGCHQINGQFVNFGPDLSLIGNKLAKDGIFTAILYPSAAIEHSFGGWTVTTKEGLVLVGYIVSETADELTLKIAGGALQTVKKIAITKREEMKVSLMPPGLAATIGAQGLVDLVAYLQTLK